MKKFSKDDAEKLGTLAEELRSAWAEVTDVLADIEDKIENELNGLIRAYNEALTNAREHVEELAGKVEEYMGERSEKWAEGDAGQAYQSWLDELQNVSLDDVAEVTVNELSLPEPPDHAEALDQLPQEPQG